MAPSLNVPMQFDSLTIEQMQRIETKAIHKNDNVMRFESLRAAKGDREAQRRVMMIIREDPSWIQ